MNIKIQSLTSSTTACIKDATPEYIENLRRLLPDVIITEISDEEYEKNSSPKTLKLVVDSTPRITGV